MKALVIGGTGFVGRHLVQTLLDRGHQVTLFNRGKTDPGLFPSVETIIGDRDVSLDPLRNRRWDFAIDTNGRLPIAARSSAKLLRQQVDHYSFISSISAYAALQPKADNSKVDLVTEDSPLAYLREEDIEDTAMITYGGRKAVCEQWIQEEWQGGALIIRPGLIVGPWDSTDRFSYWPIRLAEGGDIVAPGTGDDPVRFIDARDLASWFVSLIEKKATGTFNCIGPSEKMTMKNMLAACQSASTTPCALHWIPQTFLDLHKVQAWTDMPVWAPGLVPISSQKAKESGLIPRPTSDTALDIIQWAIGQNLKRPLKAGLTKDREREILQSWLKRHT